MIAQLLDFFFECRFDVWRQGAHAVWIDGAGIRIETAHRRRGDRPWVETTPRQ